MLIDGSRMAIAGLASGLDTAAVVDGLMAVESRPLERLGWEQALWTERRSRWTAIRTDVDALVGATRELLEPGAWADEDAAVTAVRRWVDAYGELTARLADQVDDERVARPRTRAEHVAGPLASDSRVFELLDQLRRLARPLTGGVTTPEGDSFGVGIETAAALSGAGAPASARLVLDEAALREALDAHGDDVRSLFTDGLAPAASRLLGSWRHGGVVDAALDGAGRTLVQLQSQADAMGERLADRRRHLEEMFERMEGMLARLRSQGGALANAIGALPRSGSLA